MKKKKNVKNKFNDISSTLIGIIILAAPFIISMIMSKVNIIKIIFIELIIYILAYIILENINNKLIFKPTFNQQYYRDIPQIKPAILLYCLKGNQYEDIHDFYATILDLINRNFLELIMNLDSSNYKIKINKEKDFSELCTFEKNVIELLFGNSNITEMKFSDLKRKIKEDNLFHEKVAAWKMLVELEAKENEYEIKNRKITILKRICIIISIISTCMVYVLLMCRVCVNEIIHITIIGMFIISLTLYQIKEKSFSQKVVDEIEKGKALKRYFEEYSLIDEKQLEEIKIWEGFLVYAIILEHNEKVQKYFDNIFK